MLSFFLGRLFISFFLLSFSFAFSPPPPSFLLFTSRLCCCLYFLSLSLLLFSSLIVSLTSNTSSRGNITHYNLPYYVYFTSLLNTLSTATLLPFCLFLFCSSFHHIPHSFIPFLLIHSPLHSTTPSLTRLSPDPTTTPSYIQVGSCHK